MEEVHFQLICCWFLWYTLSMTVCVYVCICICVWPVLHFCWCSWILMKATLLLFFSHRKLNYSRQWKKEGEKETEREKERECVFVSEQQKLLRFSISIELRRAHWKVAVNKNEWNIFCHSISDGLTELFFPFSLSLWLSLFLSFSLAIWHWVSSDYCFYAHELFSDSWLSQS